MKKIILSLMTLIGLGTAHADEGMWTIYNLPPQVFEQMQAEGFQLSYNELCFGDSALKNAVVNFSGYCSGVVVSPDGLVFTNHHCGFEAIRSHSTVEHDYMLNGFYAKTLEEELPNENMFVAFMIDQKDITDRIMAQGFDLMTSDLQAAFLDSLENVMSQEIKKEDSTLRLEIKPFYEGNKYYATTYRDFTDLRLVFTVPKSMAETPTTGCGHAKPATSQCSASTPTRRPTARLPIHQRMCPTTPPVGHRSPCKAIKKAITP